jgi:hypothetical protein
VSIFINYCPAAAKQRKVEGKEGDKPIRKTKLEKNRKLFINW